MKGHACCAECELRPVRYPAKGLCRVCYDRQRRVPADHEPTEAELEATVAEQMRCLPGWWAEDARRQFDGADDTLRRVAGVLRLAVAGRLGVATLPPGRRAA